MATGCIVACRVISLPGSERVDSFLGQPGAAGFVVHDGFDGRNGGGRNLFDLDAYSHRVGGEPTGGQIGCAISHASLVRSFANMPGNPNDWMLVAEDDARFTDDFEQVLESLCRINVDADLIVLADPWEIDTERPIRGPLSDGVGLSLLSRRVAKRLVGGSYRLGHFAGVAWGAGLYLITRRGSRKYRDYLDEHFSGRPAFLADDYGLLKSMGLDIMFLRPNLAYCGGPSTTSPGYQLGSGYRRDAEENGFRRVRRLLALRSRLHNLRSVLRATRLDLYGRTPVDD